MTTLNILYHGLSCFEIEAKSSGGGQITIVCDPYNTKGTGLRLPRTLAANILTVSRDNDLHNNTEAVEKPEFLITEPGEYEKGGVFVYGIPSKIDVEDNPSSHPSSAKATDDKEATKDKGKVNVIYRYEFDDIVVAHLGDLTHTLTDAEFSALENVDILLLPVGGGDHSSREATNGEGTIDYKKAVEIANQVEPRIIIPMHYAMPGLSVKLDAVDKFLKEYGVKSETMNKLKVAKKDLPEEDTRVMILEKS
jgi:hypothetical protein